MSSNDSVLVQKHVQFALRCLRLLPQPYQSEDATRMSLAFFALSTLELLGALQEKVVSKEKEDYVNWIYAQQLPSGGFRGSPACQTVCSEPSSRLCRMMQSPFSLVITS